MSWLNVVLKSEMDSTLPGIPASVTKCHVIQSGGARANADFAVWKVSLVGRVVEVDLNWAR